MIKIINILPLSHLTVLKSYAIRWLVTHGQIIKKLTGANLALAMIAGGLLPTNSLVSSVDLGLSLPQNSIIEAVANSGVITPEIEINTESGIQLPVSGYLLTQGYSIWHPAVDFAVKIGTPVRPIMVGFVEKVDRSRFAYGNSIIINHGDGMTSLYAHLSRIDAEVGEEVTLNTIIGATGSTGRSSGPHLHIEIRENEKPINPFSVLPSRVRSTLTASQQ